MSQELFRVTPIASYEKARYLAAPIDEPETNDEVMEERYHPLTLVILFLLVAGIAVGLIGCYMRSDYVDPPADGGPDGAPPPPPPPPPCNDGEIRCADDWNVETCQDEEWISQSCYQYCVENFGYDYVSWGGCNAEEEDPCDCHYDIIDGDYYYCSPDELYCIDDYTIEFCNPETLWYEQMDCNDYCVETYGPDYYSTGCNPDDSDPCHCLYGMIDGEMAECTPGDVICYDEATLGECIDYYYAPVDCVDRCEELHGSEAESAGCDATAEDPCQCLVPGSGSGSGK